MVTTSAAPAPRSRSSVVIGSLWMVFLSIVLSFIPLLNGLIAGLVGGYKVGGVARALVAAILPSIAAAAGLWVVFALFDAPVWGFVAGATVGFLIVLSDVGLFIGAAIGGAFGRRG